MRRKHYWGWWKLNSAITIIHGEKTMDEKTKNSLGISLTENVLLGFNLKPKQLSWRLATLKRIDYFRATCVIHVLEWIMKFCRLTKILCLVTCGLCLLFGYLVNMFQFFPEIIVARSVRFGVRNYFQYDTILKIRWNKFFDLRFSFMNIYEIFSSGCGPQNSFITFSNIL